jgi:hypothetical protein
VGRKQALATITIGLTFLRDRGFGKYSSEWHRWDPETRQQSGVAAITISAQIKTDFLSNTVIIPLFYFGNMFRRFSTPSSERRIDKCTSNTGCPG